MNEKYKKIIKWVVGITIGVTALILLIVFIKPSSSLPPNMVNCCIKDQCHQLKSADCAKQGGVPNCNTCSSGSGVNCGQTMLSCTTDNDCHNCQEFHQGVQMSCVQPQGSSGGKVCAPTNAKQECKTEYGGINVWSAWDNPDRMEWDCLCGAGNYAAGANPDGNTVCNINPDICQKGTFTWDVSKKTNPDAGYCFCPSGTTMYTQISGGYPICIPTDGLTEMMYTDLYVKGAQTNLKYGQTYLLKHVDSGTHYLHSCGSLGSPDCNSWTCTASHPEGVGTLLGSREDSCDKGKIKLLSYNNDKADGQNVTSGEKVILKFVDTNLNLRPCGHFSENSKVMVIGSSDNWGFTINTQTQSPVKSTDEVWFTDVKQGYIDVQQVELPPYDCICPGDILVMSPTVTKTCYFQLVPVDDTCKTAP